MSLLALTRSAQKTIMADPRFCSYQPPSPPSIPRCPLTLPDSCGPGCCVFPRMHGRSSLFPDDCGLKHAFYGSKAIKTCQLLLVRHMPAERTGASRQGRGQRPVLIPLVSAVLPPVHRIPADSYSRHARAVGPSPFCPPPRFAAVLVLCIPRDAWPVPFFPVDAT